MPTRSQRIFLGFVAGAISVLVFHQGALAILHALGLSHAPPFRTVLIPPFWVPLIVSLSFWGGVYGAVFGAVLPFLRIPPWLAGLGLGLVSVAIGWFIVAPLKGNPVAAGFEVWPMARSVLLNLCWGLGTSLLFPLLTPRPLWRRAHG